MAWMVNTSANRDPKAAQCQAKDFYPDFDAVERPEIVEDVDALERVWKAAFSLE